MTSPWLRGSLRVLSAFAGSEVAARYGLDERAKRWLARGAQRGAALLRRSGSRERPEAEGAPEPPFDLTPTEDQELVRGTMRRFAEEVLRPAAGDADDALEPPGALLEAAAGLGLGALAVPERWGGASEERSPVTWTLVAEALAWGDMGLGFALLATPSVATLIVDHGTDAQRRALLPPFAADEVVAAPALLERRPLFDPARLATRARTTSRGYRLRGDKHLVPLGRAASLFLVSADLDGQGPRLFVVEADRRGVLVDGDPTMGLRGAGPCRLRMDVELGRDALLGGEEADHQRVVDAARIGWGALAVGQCQAVLEHVIGYCNDRVAFGEPISHRQAVAFAIADMAVELDGMRLMVWRAAARAERGLDVTRAAHLARVQCADKAMRIGTDGVQLLGGAGYVRDHPMERWYRHLRAVGIAEGGVAV